MKVVCIGDVFVTPEMMEQGVRPFLAPEDELQTFFFGVPDRSAMRIVAKELEEGGRERIAVPDGLFEAVADAEVIINHLSPINRDLLEAAPKLKAVMSCRGGMENLDVAAATELGIIISNNPAHNANAVAEYAIGLILSETRNISRSHFALKNGEWRKVYPNSKTTIRELCDMTVGIVGFGSIGRLVAEKLKPFGCQILAYDPFMKNPGEDVEAVSFDDLLTRSDIVTLHARSDHAIMNDREFGLMKENSYLINSARSYLVDPEAFCRAMDSGKLIGAAFDVFETEPDIPEFYLKYDNVTLTSHRAGDTINAYKDAPKFAIRNYLGWKNGGELMFWANKPR